MMLRNLGLAAAISTALTLSIAGVARSQAIPPNTPKSEQPLCYFQTANGKFLNLDSLCGRSNSGNIDSEDSNSHLSNKPQYNLQSKTRALRGEI
jgi:hypothetical protein